MFMFFTFQPMTRVKLILAKMAALATLLRTRSNALATWTSMD